MWRDIGSLFQILGGKSGFLRNTCQHSGANLFIIMECVNEISPPSPAKHLM